MFFFMLSLGPSSPLGDSDLPYVQCANMMVARVMLLLLLLKFLNCTFVLEQPSGSLFLSCSNWKLSLSILKCAILLKVYFATQRLWTHPRAALVQSVWKLYSTNTSMGAYNNWCQKPTLLTSNRHWWFEWFKLVSADAKVCVCESLVFSLRQTSDSRCWVFFMYKKFTSLCRENVKQQVKHSNIMIFILA